MSTQQEEMKEKLDKVSTQQEEMYGERTIREGERNKNEEEKHEEKIQVSLENFPVILPTELDKYKFKILTKQDNDSFLEYFREIKFHMKFPEELTI